LTRLISLQERSSLGAKLFNLPHRYKLAACTEPWRTKKKAEFEILPFLPAIQHVHYLIYKPAA
jgi:hypothetical protein